MVGIGRFPSNEIEDGVLPGEDWLACGAALANLSSLFRLTAAVLKVECQ